MDTYDQTQAHKVDMMADLVAIIKNKLTLNYQNQTHEKNIT